ncbi:MAG: nucleoside-diphosphate kinase [Candidatus Cloacimonetes bacterium]|nr:nucleoside-diphosphate kinase [Candidatus Cloacimonadota bacterium]
MKEFTLLLVKPNAVEKQRIGNILHMVEQNGFIINDLKMLKMSKEIAEEFYSIHKEKPFFDELVSFMTSGEIVAAVLRMENAVHQLRELVGSTNPALANPGTIRYLYGEAVNRNAVHASDSIENAVNEISLIFPGFFKKSDWARYYSQIKNH